MDVRVLCGRPLPLSLRRPDTIFSTWLTFRRRLASLQWEAVDGVPVVYFPYLAGTLSGWLWEASYRDALVRAWPWVQSTFPFDLVHAHTANPDGFAVLHAVARTSIPFVLTEHTGPFHVITDRPRMRRQTLAALLAARRVWCVSKSLHREVCAFLADSDTSHIQVLPNGVDTERFFPPADWRPDPFRPNLLFVGVLCDVKNPLLLLAALAQVRQQIPGVCLHLAGDGPLRKIIADRIRELQLGNCVRMYGYCDRVEVARLLRDVCDVLVLPSRSETFGVVLIEALATGKPVVATRCGGPESIVTDGTVGMLCLPDDVSALANALLQTIRRLPDVQPMKIRQYACQHFDYRRLVRDIASGYRQVISDQEFLTTKRTEQPLSVPSSR